MRFIEKKTAVQTYNELRNAFGDETMMERHVFVGIVHTRKAERACELQGGRSTPVTALTEVNINTGVAMIRTDPLLTV